MHYLTVSFSYKQAPLEVREQLNYTDEEKKGCLKKLIQSSSINEVVILNTCNRIEYITSCKDIEDAKEHIFTMLELKTGMLRGELLKYCEIFDDSTAIHHLFAVASSIDSMVVGETQIAGQLKDAFRFSYDNGFCSKKISRAMSHAFKCAAKVRASTDISSRPVSVASVAIKMMKDIVNDLSGKKALVIGVGEMSEISTKHLIDEGVDTYITNRTHQKAEILAKDLGAKTYHFGELEKGVNEFDIIFSATSSSMPIITEDMIERRDFKRFWFDLAIPRDIESVDDENIKLVVIDDLKAIVEKNIEERRQFVRQAQSIIGRSVVEFFEWLDALNVEPIIKDIYIKAQEAAEEEAKRVIKKGFIPKEYEDSVKKLAYQSIKRFLHDMTKQMREASNEAKSDSVTGAFQYILNSKNDNIPDKYKKD